MMYNMLAECLNIFLNSDLIRVFGVLKNQRFMTRNRLLTFWQVPKILLTQLNPHKKDCDDHTLKVRQTWNPIINQTLGLTNSLEKIRNILLFYKKC